MFTYRQSTGEMTHEGAQIGVGYSGAPGFKNKPQFQSLPSQGPIPQGNWHITSLTRGETPHGPYVIRLTALPGTETFGRAGFLIHGDSKIAPGTASEGCIILPLEARMMLWETLVHTGDETLEVIA